MGIKKGLFALIRRNPAQPRPVPAPRCNAIRKGTAPEPSARTAETLHKPRSFLAEPTMRRPGKRRPSAPRRAHRPRPEGQPTRTGGLPCAPPAAPFRPAPCRPGKPPPAGKSPRCPGNRAVCRAREEHPVCSARPGKALPPAGSTAGPSPAPPSRWCAAPPSRRPEGPPHAQPTGVPRKPGGCAANTRCTPQGGFQSLWAIGWRPRPPLTQKKQNSNGGLTPYREGG